MVPPAGAARILVAEDDPEFGYMLECWLRQRGYTCVRVRDAAAAVLALAEGGFDLVLSDIDMPGNRGLAVVKHITERGGYPPVILLTGKPSLETAVDAVGSPVIAYLFKPPDIDNLARRIEQALAIGAVQRAGRVAEGRWREGLAALQACEARLQAGEAEGVVRAEISRVLGHFAEAAKGVAGSDSVRLQQLEDALHETISVLDDTRKAFKSRQLAELRRRLEQLS